MTGVGPVAWPPAPMETARLVLSESAARDRAAFIELFASREVGTYVGGARPRDELERAMPAVPVWRPGLARPARAAGVSMLGAGTLVVRRRRSATALFHAVVGPRVTAPTAVALRVRPRRASRGFDGIYRPAIVQAHRAVSRGTPSAPMSRVAQL